MDNGRYTAMYFFTREKHQCIEKRFCDDCEGARSKPYFVEETTVRTGNKVTSQSIVLRE